jgi:hypothetical protein
MLELKPSNDKTAETRAGDFREARAKTAELCEKAGMANAELIADLQPSAAMSDRAAPERLATRMMLGTDFDGPTCGEHGGLINPMHAATTGMDELVHDWMGKTAEEIELDSKKPTRGLFMAVGWNASPAHALIYAMSKYCALYSDRGYRVGQKYVGYVEYTKARLRADGAEAAARLDSLELIGRADDLLSIKGSRAYVSAINAPVVDRLLQPVEGSFLRCIEENKTLWPKGRLRRGSPTKSSPARTAPRSSRVCARRPSSATSTCGRCCGRSSIACRMAPTGTSSTSAPCTRRPTRTSTTTRNTLAW